MTTALNEISETLNCGHLSNAMMLMLSCYVRSERFLLYIREKQQQFNGFSHQYRFPSVRLNVSLKIQSIYDNDNRLDTFIQTARIQQK